MSAEDADRAVALATLLTKAAVELNSLAGKGGAHVQQP
ncbi:hypothetical protein BJ970_003944 [Saccharopolyspora phatthalungensis]|uniref:Uncharacterized protein n=1 Tax=Saccharopolyspora phatthalungensis TaxID=664693 RepID=A0A840Q997_9PSEU|nr:hypothetical protein [Saccharopolyspora phatthalungensis]